MMAWNTTHITSSQSSPSAARVTARGTSPNQDTAVPLNGRASAQFLHSDENQYGLDQN